LKKEVRSGVVRTSGFSFNRFNLKRAELNEDAKKKKNGAGKVEEERDLFLQLSDPSFFLLIYFR